MARDGRESKMGVGARWDGREKCEMVARGDLISLSHARSHGEWRERVRGWKQITAREARGGRERRFNIMSSRAISRKMAQDDREMRDGRERGFNIIVSRAVSRRGREGRERGASGPLYTHGSRVRTPANLI